MESREFSKAGFVIFTENVKAAEWPHLKSGRNQTLDLSTICLAHYSFRQCLFPLVISVKTTLKNYSRNYIKLGETCWGIAAVTRISVFPGKQLILILLYHFWETSKPKHLFIFDHLLWYFFHLVGFSVRVKDQGFTCVIFRIQRQGVQGKILVVRACNRNVIETLILVVSSILGLLARPLVINLGFPKQETSGKFI